MKIFKDIFNIENGGYIVTGGMGLLGKAHCHAIAAFGGTPIIIDLNVTGFNNLKKEIFEKYEKEIFAFEADITSRESLEKVLKDIKKFSNINGLINNAARNPAVNKAGLESNSRFENISLEEWRLDIEVGLTGAFLCTQIFGTEMAKNKGGSIINISSDLGLIAPKQSLYEDENLSFDKQPKKPVMYSVVKSGLIGLTKYTSTYWPDKVRCNCICPGGIFNNQSEQFLKKVIKEIPLGRLANIDEYGGMIIYLLSSASSYMNGSTISIDGGRTVW